MEKFWIQFGIDVLNFVSFFFDVATYPIYYVLYRPWKRLAMARRIRAVPIRKSNEEVCYRTADGPADLHVKLLTNEIDTMEKTLRFATKLNTNKKFLGTREIIAEEDEVQPDGKVFKKYRLGGYKWLSFIEVEQKAKEFGRGLRALGVEPKDRVVMFAETRAEFMIAVHGLFKQNCTIVTIYATLGDEGITHGITETEVDTVITSYDLLPKIKRILNTIPKVKRVIYFEDQLNIADTSGFGNVEVFSFSQVIKKGSESVVDEVLPTKKDTAIIMYTSGSTGIPKGVVLSHGNLIACMMSASDRFPVYPNDVYIGFLPLAHVFELMAETVSSIVGVPIGYSNALTLLDTSPKVMRGCQGDASVLRPTCMSAVPLILDRVTKGINDKVQNGNAIQQILFKFAYAYKQKWIAKGFRTPLIDLLVFRKVAMLLGGRVRLIVSGGAPISVETQSKITLCFETIVHQGYGLTETCAGTTVSDRFNMDFGHCGQILMCCDVKLINWEEGNYRVTNKPNPQGEIIIGGDNVAIGYYKHPDLTAESFFEEDGKRWFKTGDIGEFLPDGNLKVIDRKKDLVKLQHGEYISLGKVEAILKTCPFVDNICVFADSFRLSCVALISPNEKALVDLAALIGIKTTDYEKICADTRLVKHIYDELVVCAQQSGLIKFEIPSAISLCTEPWTPDSDLVTAAFKIRRKQIYAHYQSEIEMMYKK